MIRTSSICERSPSNRSRDQRHHIYDMKTNQDSNTLSCYINYQKHLKVFLNDDCWGLYAEDGETIKTVALGMTSTLWLCYEETRNMSIAVFLRHFILLDQCLSLMVYSNASSGTYARIFFNTGWSSHSIWNCLIVFISTCSSVYDTLWSQFRLVVRHPPPWYRESDV